MARSRPEFAEFVATLSADDKELLTDLKSAEMATKTSAGVMQSSLDRVTVSSKAGAGGLHQYASAADRAGQSSQNATRSITALSAAAGATGSTALQSTSQVAMLVAATDELAVGLGALGVGAVAAGAAILPIAIAAGVVTFAVVEMNKALNARIAVLDDTRKATEASLQPLRDQIELLRDRSFVRLGGLTEKEAHVRALERTGITENELKLRMQIFRWVKLESELKDKAQRAADQERKHLAAVLTHRSRQLDMIRREKQETDAIAAKERERLATSQRRASAAASEALSRREQLTAAAQGVLVGAGAAVPSQFIKDPLERRIAELGERLNRATPTATTGTFGLLSTPSPLSAVRGGEVLGRQQLSTAEQQKQISKDHKEIARQARDLLSEILQATRIGGLTPGQALRLSGGP